MTPDDYGQGAAFQAEKQTVFSRSWLPLAALGQLARPGDFVSATVGGWSVVGTRDGQRTTRVLRNACRHQNMQVVGTPAGNCQAFRCRFHGWTYDLAGRFVSAPAPSAPKATGPELDLETLPCIETGGLLFFGLQPPDEAPALPAIDAAYGGTLVTEIACNWKVAVEHLLAEHAPSPNFAWLWPLLTWRRAGGLVIVEQVVPHTFLRTRLFTHVFGGEAAGQAAPAAAIKQTCETLQADRLTGVPAVESPLVADFHARLRHHVPLPR